MDEDWDDTPSYETPSGGGFDEPIDSGRNFSRGRGFVKASTSIDNDSGCGGNNMHSWGDDSRSGGRRGGRGGGFRGNRDENSNGTYSANKFGGRNNNNNDDGWGNDSGSNDVFKSNRGRGGRGGRGRGGFRGNNHNNGFGDVNEDDDWGVSNNGVDQGDSGFRRGRGRGGSRGGRGRSFDDKGGDKNGPEKPREIYVPPDPTNDLTEMFSTAITTGINFDKYDNIPVDVTGENVVPAIKSFKESGLRPLLLENIEKSGYLRPTPIQKTAIPTIMAGRDIMACAQTGSGKTAAFLLPIIHCLIAEKIDLAIDNCEPQVVIVSPTRELAVQIHMEARKFAYDSGIKTVVAYGGTSVRHQITQLRNGCHILVATPGRMNDFVNKNIISFASVRFVVLDEADRMLDMGFLPAIEEMLNHQTMVPTGERQTLMFSATFPEEIQKLAGNFLHNYLFITVGIVGGACSDVQQIFYQVEKFSKRDKLAELLKNQGRDVKTLVFVERKKNADFIATFLSEHNLATTTIHGDRQQSEREEALRDFKTGFRNILVATDVAARGLDIKNVQHVINFDLPKSIDEYVHRIGRTGRVGNRGSATSFFDSNFDCPLAPDLVKILKQANQEVPDWLQRAGGGGSSKFNNDNFGGRDVRGNEYGQAYDAEKEVEEPGEEW